ncbi:MAG: hypothetical protein MI892_28150 [Desulfobacterales bacterium]|nr:hypothetical protein [Desulfobacterales bacterium]
MRTKNKSIFTIIKKLWKKKKFVPLLLAFSFLVLSITIIVLPNPQLGLMVYQPSFDVDLTKGKWILGPILFLYSIYSIVKVVRSDSEVIQCKCINCGRLSVVDISTKPKCHSCGGKIERLEGFFDRYPEFKNDDQQ